MLQALFEPLDARMLMSANFDLPRVPTSSAPVNESDHAIRSDPSHNSGRILLAQLEVFDGVLTIAGTHANDVITISRAGPPEIHVKPRSHYMHDGSVTVLQVKDGPNGPVQVVEATPASVQLAKDLAQRSVIIKVGDRYLADEFWTFDLTEVHVDAGAGDDLVRVSKNLRIKAFIRGGAGNDTLLAGHANDQLRGGAGDDRLVSAGGLLDHYRGGDGIDSLTGSLKLDPGRPIVFTNEIEHFDQITVISR